MGNTPHISTNAAKTVNNGDIININTKIEFFVYRADIVSVNNNQIADDGNMDNYVTGDHGCKFIINAAYSESEKIQDIMDAVIKFVNKKYYPWKCELKNVDTKHSFIKENDIFSLSNKSIINWKKQHIMKQGLLINITRNVTRQHIIKSTGITCQYMKKNGNSKDPLHCPIYYSMKEEYEWNKQNLDHLTEFDHFNDEFGDKPDCKYNDQCKSYQRLEEGGHEINDLCHVKLYKHPPRSRSIQLQENIHSLIINKTETQNHPLYKPKDNDYQRYSYNKSNGFISALIAEVIANGFKTDLCLTDDDVKENKCSLLSVVEAKMKCNRYISMGTPLNRAQMLSLVLYTGCECNYDLCKSQRNGHYDKWKWFDYCLYNAIKTLSLHESGSFSVFSGLNKVKLDVKSVPCGYFVTYVSTSWNKGVAQAFIQQDEGMLIKIDELFKNRKFVYCCDVSWISKFPDECEILFARSLHGFNDAFQCVVLDDSNGVQSVSLSLMN